MPLLELHIKLINNEVVLYKLTLPHSTLLGRSYSKRCSRNTSISSGSREIYEEGRVQLRFPPSLSQQSEVEEGFISFYKY